MRAFSGIVFVFKIRVHRNADNSLESFCVLIHVLVRVLKQRDKVVPVLN
jgi:hypothetical protein